MNPHFIRNVPPKDYEFDDLPKLAYAQFERVEPETGPGPWVISLDAISADWIGTEVHANNDFLNVFSLQAMEQAWNNYGAAAARKAPSTPNRPPQNPLANAPLYRVEIDIGIPGIWSPLHGWIDLDVRGPKDIGDIEREWFDLEFSQVSTPLAHPCRVYPNAFAAPVLAFVCVTRIPRTHRIALGLTRLVSLDDLPEIDAVGIQNFLETCQGAEYLAAYDVGQGNSNGLLAPSITDNHSPILYYDVGCGVYGNAHTTPSPLNFCFQGNPFIVMSHWDSDHWMGVCGSGSPLLVQGFGVDWIAPYQNITTHHKTFALDIIAQGGTILIYRPATPVVSTASLTPNVQVRFTTGSGSGRNHTGIVLAFEKRFNGNWRSWLLTGDCDYGYMTHLSPTSTVAVVVPHHGASPATTTAPPPPTPAYAATTYVRAIYSFGPGNKHSTVQHPTRATVDKHVLQGWNQGAWAGITPGDSIAGPDILATSQHIAPFARGGCLVGWATPPTLPIAPCMCGCSITLTQV
jgi:hypothetical protein